MAVLKHYESEWNGLNLAEIAHAMGRNAGAVAKPDFYRFFYQRLQAANFDFNAAWLQNKQFQSRRMRYYFDKFNLELGYPARALSIGAGLGVVEAPLLKAGYDLTLQECQDHSFAYLRQSGLRFQSWIGEDLKLIPAQPFDIIFIFTVSYAISPRDYPGFLRAVRQLLRPGGRLVLWDPVPSLKALPGLRRVKDRLKRRHSIFWGWLRTPVEHRRALRQSGFHLDEFYMTDHDDMQYTALSWRIGIHGLSWGQDLAQWFICRRPERDACND